MSQKYIIELTEKQAQTVLAAVEEFFRLRMGQANLNGLADDLAFSTYDRSKDTTGRGFDLALQRRDNINHVLKAIFHIAWPIYGAPEKRTERELIAGDIWSQLRWEMSTKEPYMSTPIQLGSEPLPKVTVIADDGKSEEESA